MNENLTINIKLDDSIKDTLKTGKKFGIAAFIFFIIIFIVTITAVISGFRFIFKSFNDNILKDNNIVDIIDKNDNKDDILEEFDKSKNKYEIQEFNSSIEMYSGTESSFFVKHLLDKINTSNQTEDRKINVKFNDIETADREQIINIKSSLEDRDYEVVIDYGADGYINKVEIR